MNTAEKTALKLYPEEWIQVGGNTIDKNALERAAFIKGYNEAKNNLPIPRWRIMEDFHELKEGTDYDRYIITEDAGGVILYDTWHELYLEARDLEASQDEDDWAFVEAKKQCPFRDEECKFCKLKRQEILKYASDCLPEYCVCDGKCDYMTKHDMDEMKAAYDEI